MTQKALQLIEDKSTCFDQTTQDQFQACYEELKNEVDAILLGPKHTGSSRQTHQTKSKGVRIEEID